ncbi:MAG: rRNA maturation RNase YbeY [Christensenella hongkongensis]|uniref:rRNA maturation RNase YbeY n=1 Tax=Christensenella hongkongensis TaxID=270498 RepID=UPI002A7586E8|nr:rRNA maturation RNase YbeY [Christensenella hongkongensis]MDY3004045.1 rRNA maturation RNase YbeY [Christensenella hongkongensis]
MEITFFDEQDKIELTQQMKEAVKAALGAAEHDAGVAACVNLLFTDDEGICALNREFRGIDSATDVLSFPAYELGELLEDSLDEIDAEYIDGRLFLGDIAVSLERAVRQAEEYGHGLVRETAFLALHGTLHLLGYDHMTEQDERQMTGKQRELLDSVNIGRDMDG